MNPVDPLFGPVLVTLALVSAGLCCAIGCALVWLAEKVGAWRARRRRMKRLRTPQPYDARFQNSVAAKDWRDVERAEKLLRQAA